MEQGAGEEESLNIDYARNVWVPRLRSGKYSQTTEYLNSADGWCCLGVAVDERRTWVSCKGYDRDVRGYVYVLADGTVATSLDGKPLLATRGLSDVDRVFLFGDADPDGLHRLFTTMNDGLGLSFDDIADVIEQLCDEPDTLARYEQPSAYYRFERNDDGRLIIDVINERPENVGSDHPREDDYAEK